MDRKLRKKIVIKNYLAILKEGLPYFAASVCISTAFFLRGGYYFIWLISFSAAMLFCAVKIFSSNETILFIIFGIAAGSVISIRYVPEKFFVPKEKTITALEGILKKESRRVSNGSSLYELANVGIYMSDIFIGYEGDIRVFVRDGEKGYWGDSVRFEKIRRSGKKGECFSAGKMIDHGSSLPFFNFRKRVLRAVEKKLKLIFGEESFLAEAFFTGNRDDLPPGLNDLFRESGASHILALSGMHLGMISLFLFLVAGKFSGHILFLAAVNIVNVSYLLLSGLSPSLLRAVVMFWLISYAKISGAETDLFRILFIAFALSLMIFPDFLFSLSFQLSFISLAGIIILAPPVSSFLGRILPSCIALPAACSAAAVISTSVVSLYHFGIVYFSGIFTSLLLSPLITLYICLGLIFMMVPSPILIFAGSFQQKIFSFFYLLIYRIVKIFASIPGLALPKNIPFPLLIFFQLAVIVILCFPCCFAGIFRRFR